MKEKELYAHPAWESATFEGAELSILLQGLKTTFREKLEWQEEAETLALKFEAARRRVEQTGSEFPEHSQ